MIFLLRENSSGQNFFRRENRHVNLSMCAWPERKLCATRRVASSMHSPCNRRRTLYTLALVLSDLQLIDFPRGRRPPRSLSRTPRRSRLHSAREEERKGTLSTDDRGVFAGHIGHIYRLGRTRTR